LSNSSRIVLSHDRAAVLRKTLHPWVFRQAVQSVEGDPAAGLCAVEDPTGTRLGWGFYSEASLIAVRMVSYGDAEPPGDWLLRRMKAALLLRGSMAIDSDAFRMVNAEGDDLPGLVVDVFGDTGSSPSTASRSPPCSRRSPARCGKSCPAAGST
jgi:23S rRNA (cytosine1962-C5)-methyltransferase